MAGYLNSPSLELDIVHCLPSTVVLLLLLPTTNLKSPTIGCPPKFPLQVPTISPKWRLTWRSRWGTDAIHWRHTSTICLLDAMSWNQHFFKNETSVFNSWDFTRNRDKFLKTLWIIIGSNFRHRVLQHPSEVECQLAVTWTSSIPPIGLLNFWGQSPWWLLNLPRRIIKQLIELFCQCPYLRLSFSPVKSWECWSFTLMSSLLLSFPIILSCYEMLDANSFLNTLWFFLQHWIFYFSEPT